jgi:ubiquinone/menaquinone biosynthesis C-methylase UbiE|tara:strand:- start:1330 stop:1992 length:663 start_codon:yes stop_codon:yes gene_type:complete
MNRKKIDFNESRSLTTHETESSSALDWLKVWNVDNIYFDDERKFGYGGYKYDGRWQAIVSSLIQDFNLSKSSSLLDLGCAKGFLVNDFNNDDRVGIAEGVDISMYALLEGAKAKMNGRLVCANFTALPYENNEFSLVFCKDSLHNILSKKEVLQALREISRVGKNSWIRVGAYETDSQKKIIDNWATFATTYLHKDDWLELFDKAEYSGFYDWFHPSESI